jgi:hypothetical protein
MKFQSSFVFASLLTFVMAAPARAQVQLDWSRTFSTPGNDRTMALATDFAGNVYAAGSANSTSAQHEGTGFAAAWDFAGNQLWTRTWDSTTLTHGEHPSAIALDGAGGIFIAGVALGAPSTTNTAPFLMRIDSTGAIAWYLEQAATPTGGKLWRIPMILDAQGNPVIGTRTPGGDIQVTAYTPSGTQVWQTSYAQPIGVDNPISMALAPNGEIIVAGEVDSTANTNPGHPVLLRVSPAGSLLQSLEIVTPDMTFGRAVDVDVDFQGNIFLAARGLSGGWLAAHTLGVFGFNAQGALQWERTITGPATGLFGTGGAWPTDVEIDPFGRAIVLGGRQQGTGFGTAIVMAAFDAAGNELWRTVENDALGTSAVDLFNPNADLLIDSTGELLAVGTRGDASDLPDLTVQDAAMFAVDSSGATRFGQTYGFPPLADGSPDNASVGAKGRGQSFVLGGIAHTAVGQLGNDAFVAQFSRTARGFCFGDGSLLTQCPCGNSSEPAERAGCASSTGLGGRLADAGASSIANDTFALVGSSMTNSIAVFTQSAASAAAAVSGDGIFCGGGTMVRLGDAINVSGASQFPGPGDPSISSIGGVTTPGTRVYQVVYRNSASFCTPATFNSTNALRVNWIP